MYHEYTAEDIKRLVQRLLEGQAQAWNVEMFAESQLGAASQYKIGCYTWGAAQLMDLAGHVRNIPAGEMLEDLPELIEVAPTPVSITDESKGGSALVKRMQGEIDDLKASIRELRDRAPIVSIPYSNVGAASQPVPLGVTIMSVGDDDLTGGRVEEEMPRRTGHPKATA